MNSESAKGRLHPFSRRMQAVMIFLIMGFIPGIANGQSPDDAVTPTRSVAQWIAYVDSVGRLDPQPWISNAMHIRDSLLRDFEDIDAQLSPDDWKALMAARKTGRLAREAALRIFQVTELAAVEDLTFPLDSAKVTWVSATQKGRGEGIEMVVLNASEIAWEEKIYYFHRGCLLGSQLVFHKYGLHASNAVTSSGLPIASHNYCLGSGTGAWEFATLCYTAAEGHLIPMGWTHEEVNLANPCTYNRHLEGKTLSMDPLTIRYTWEIDLGFRNRGKRPTFSGKTDVTYRWDTAKRVLIPQFRSANLDAEKLLAFNLSAPKEFVVHAWQRELRAILQGKDDIRRRAVIEFLEEGDE